jgi:valyl-tRNA synthetase
MPPPNITGQLHCGHALFATLQDISTRYHRMQGRRTLWLPGTDHAGLATQAKLDDLMRAQGLDPAGPEFDAFAADYRRNLKSTITGQLRRCGASCDWSRETFTLDEKYSRAVYAAWDRIEQLGMTYTSGGDLFIRMADPARRLLDAMDRNEIEIIPQGQAGTLRNFLENIEDWNVGRRIRWGHRIPGHEMVFDTWFSSALWPFASLGWPEETQDLRDFYPAAMIETADDILFFWCARMLMMGLLLTDQLPFRTIFLHGLIRDKDGEKMSKSEGNGIDPLEIIDRYGCDSMRFALAEAATPGQDMRLWDDRFQAGKAIRTKLWNAARYALGHWERMGRPTITRPETTHEHDRLMIRIVEANAERISGQLDGLSYHEAARKLRSFLFEDLCGWYIENTKHRLYQDQDAMALMTLMWSLDQTLRLFHPFMPFVTERIRGAYSDVPLITDTWASF